MLKLQNPLLDSTFLLVNQYLAWFSSQELMIRLLLLLSLLFLFFTPALAAVSHWSLSVSKSRVSNTLLSILADPYNAVVWMVSTHPLICKSSSPFNNPLVTVQRASITIGIIVMFHSFSILSQGPGTYPSSHFLSVLPCGQSGKQSSQFDEFSLFFVDYFKGWSSG